MSHPNPGQVCSGAVVNGKVYLANYGRPALMVYDPDRPFECTVNPRLMGSVGHEQGRPKGATSLSSQSGIAITSSSVVTTISPVQAATPAFRA